MSALNLIGIVIGAIAGGLSGYHYGWAGLGMVVMGQLSILLVALD